MNALSLINAIDLAHTRQWLRSLIFFEFLDDLVKGIYFLDLNSMNINSIPLLS